MRGLDVRKTIEVLKAIFENDIQSPYEVYRKTSLSLASTYRYVRKLLNLGVIKQENGHYTISLKGLLILSYVGVEDAIKALSKAIGFDEFVVSSFINSLRELLDLGTIMASDIRHIEDLTFLILKSVHGNYAEFKKYVGSPSEPLFAYLLVTSLPKIRIKIREGCTVECVYSSGIGVIAYACKCNSCLRCEHPASARLFSSPPCIPNLEAKLDM